MRKFLLPVAALVALGFVLLAQDGPKKEVGETVARPRNRKDAPIEAEQPKIPSKLNRKDKLDVSEQPDFKVDSSVVNVDVAVLDNKGRFIPNIPRGNFRILEDNVPQQVSNFGTGEAPMTVCMVIEFSNLFQQYYTESWYQTLQASYGFLETLKKEDYVAIVAYDMRPEILSDFSTDKSKAQEAMQRLRIAAFSESNLYDALTDTADRMKDLEGRKAIVLIASGRDTFSKLTFDKTRKILQNDAVPIYAIGLMQALREYYDARGAMVRSPASTFCRRTIRCGRSPRRPAANRSSRASTASSRPSITPFTNLCGTNIPWVIALRTRPRTASTARSKWNW